MYSRRILGFLVLPGLLILIFLPLGPRPCWGFSTPHPLLIYEKGEAILDQYKGASHDLDEAETLFKDLIEKHPRSALGYLGMSRLSRIDAYLYGERFNMKKIKEKALPFATKAMELGPSLQDVHENYAVFEGIFEQHFNAQKDLKGAVYLFPDKAETHYAVAMFMHDQEEYSKALKYYAKALDMEPSQSLRLKIYKRMALIYLEEYDAPYQAIESVSYTHLRAHET